MVHVWLGDDDNDGGEGKSDSLFNGLQLLYEVFDIEDDDLDSSDKESQIELLEGFPREWWLMFGDFLHLPWVSTSSS